MRLGLSALRLLGSNLRGVFAPATISPEYEDFKASIKRLNQVAEYVLEDHDLTADALDDLAGDR